MELWDIAVGVVLAGGHAISQHDEQGWLLLLVGWHVVVGWLVGWVGG